MYSHHSGIRKINKWYIIAALLLTLSAAGYVGFRLIKSSSPFPSNVTKNAPFKLYHPKNLPQGYSVDQKSYSSPEKGVVTFNISQPGGPAIGVAEQNVPPDFNFNQQSNAPAGVRLPTTHFSTAAGQATIDQWGPKKVCYIVAGQTWIIMNVTGIKDDQIRLIARSFESV